jgi:heterodisulfide reductase subunit B2
MTTLSYFPGCSLKGTGRAYDESLRPVFKALDVELEELDDWNCCGATAYMAVDEVKACVMASRNLAIAEKAGPREILAPCSACYLVLNKTKHYIHESPSVHNVVNQALKAANLTYSGNTPVRHPLDVLVNTIGLDAIKKRVKNPLRGLKVAPYYGCQIVRPYATFDDQYNPTTMDRLLEAIGCLVLKDFPVKTRCCGGSLTGTLPEPGLLCAQIILKEALKRGADCIATVCPLCQFNLDGYHDKIEAKWGASRIPTVYFSQLMGLAFGMSEREMALHRGFIPFKMPAPAPAAARPQPVAASC